LKVSKKAHFIEFYNIDDTIIENIKCSYCCWKKNSFS